MSQEKQLHLINKLMYKTQKISISNSQGQRRWMDIFEKLDKFS